MKTGIHFLMVFIAALFWIVGCSFFFIAFIFTWLADKLIPYSIKGNCWSFAGPLWVKYGGYLLIRPADGQRVFGIFPILHVAWVKNLDPRGLELLQFFPTKRKNGRFMPWHVLYYTGEVRDVEKPHPSSNSEWTRFESE
jgi:hypothetical protein